MCSGKVLFIGPFFVCIELLFRIYDLYYNLNLLRMIVGNTPLLSKLCYIIDRKENTMNMHLFDSIDGEKAAKEELCPGAVVLRGFALKDEAGLLAALNEVVALAPFRRMVTPGGHYMSVAMTNCGAFGWVADRTGYRYDALDPESNQHWPPMPVPFLDLAKSAAEQAGFPEFVPDACLINRYEPGTKLSLHQDKDERDFSAPIVSVSLGIPAIFLFGGLRRTDKPDRVPLKHGDVVVWGGPARLRYHGIMPLKADHHPLVGNCRVNLTLRKAH
jgi:alkylated DNA repair protein (DNA oxidative demethylase)